MCAVGICEKAKLIDVTRKQGTTESLTEARLMCTVSEKDLYLYYFVRQFAGRTLVFANSKDCVRRLSSVFGLLRCCPLVLHADMHQRQRLKNLDRFKSELQQFLSFSLLFACLSAFSARSAFYHISALRHIRPVITEEVAKTIACSFVTSRLDYANSVLYGISAKNIHRLQRMQNTLARVVLGSSASKFSQSTGMPEITPPGD